MSTVYFPAAAKGFDSPFSEDYEKIVSKVFGKFFLYQISTKLWPSSRSVSAKATYKGKWGKPQAPSTSFLAILVVSRSSYIIIRLRFISFSPKMFRPTDLGINCKWKYNIIVM